MVQGKPDQGPQGKYSTIIARCQAFFARLRFHINVRRGLTANGKTLVNIGSFWCPRHWKMIVDSQYSLETAIDPYIALMGVARALDIKFDYEIEGPVHHACDKIPSEMLMGILNVSKGWI